ncbi:GlxA family transcriptional regulator [Aliiglaciecola sp. LCG003]|uniref:GlxA family transcriptional regulator n=1 Tax=Aliiglaciecola sp. LCG003 TaxID=3053655 RepID=UPI0025738167|nr:GlxA family transcriptional regulator [Aliiglaciecola sp. LCG003]WJG08071.1 GlxA family transcriptional regulator [Aliiglaciecola sp. LCG003]
MNKKIGVLLFDKVNLFDVAGPLEVFAVASELGPLQYQIVAIGLEQKAYQSETGVKLVADHCTISDMHLDTLIIPGGAGARDAHTTESHNRWLTEQIDKCRRVMSICTGAYLLASTGVLNHKKATTHWNYIQDFAQRYPQIDVVEDQLFVDHGKIASSAGISSGIDLALALVERDCGSELALRVAKFLVLHYRRTGSQAQFSEPLRYQFSADSHFSGLTPWILQNLTNKLPVSALAEQVCMTERSFYRSFIKQMKIPPGKYVERLRLEHAKQLLVESNCAMQKVAQACGYKNLDVFRRAFERKFAISPNAYRSQFSRLQ